MSENNQTGLEKNKGCGNKFFYALVKLVEFGINLLPDIESDPTSGVQTELPDSTKPDDYDLE